MPHKKQDDSLYYCIHGILFFTNFLYKRINPCYKGEDGRTHISKPPYKIKSCTIVFLLLYLLKMYLMMNTSNITYFISTSFPHYSSIKVDRVCAAIIAQYVRRSPKEQTWIILEISFNFISTF